MTPPSRGDPEVLPLEAPDEAALALVLPVLVPLPPLVEVDAEDAAAVVDAPLEPELPAEAEAVLLVPEEVVPLLLLAAVPPLDDATLPARLPVDPLPPVLPRSPELPVQDTDAHTTTPAASHRTQLRRSFEVMARSS